MLSAKAATTNDAIVFLDRPLLFSVRRPLFTVAPPSFQSVSIFVRGHGFDTAPIPAAAFPVLLIPRIIVTLNDLPDPVYHSLYTDWAHCDAQTTVDLLSFHHWTDARQLKARVADYRQSSREPSLLEEVGYQSWAQAPQDARDEATEATLLSDAVNTAERRGLLGWVVWDAFDYVPPAGQPGNSEYFFSLWRSDLTPKPALKTLPLH